MDKANIDKVYTVLKYLYCEGRLEINKETFIMDENKKIVF